MILQKSVLSIFFDCVLKHRLSYYLGKGNILFFITQIIIYFFSILLFCCLVVLLRNKISINKNI